MAPTRMSLLSAKTLTISIDRDAQRVYEFASDPRNFPRWVTSFVRSARQESAGWVLETDGGPIGIRFAERNRFGVLDHVVRLPSGQEVPNSMRVVPNGSGSEVMFTLLRRPEMGREEFERDAAMVERDLRSLKALMERRE